MENCNNVLAVVDPGFPIGSTELVGGVRSRCSSVSKNLYVKRKESEPLGASTVGAPLDLPMFKTF